MAYVSVSRARFDVKIYTNDAETLELSRIVTKATAIQEASRAQDADQRIGPQSITLEISQGRSMQKKAGTNEIERQATTSGGVTPPSAQTVTVRSLLVGATNQQDSWVRQQIACSSKNSLPFRGSLSLRWHRLPPIHRILRNYGFDAVRIHLPARRIRMKRDIHRTNQLLF
jgi:hypothetical protein